MPLLSLRFRLMLPVALALLPVSLALAWTAAQASPGDAVVLVASLALVAVVGVLSFGVAWLASETLVVQPTRAVVDASRRVARGDLAARTGVSGSGGELNELARAFDEMAASLEAQQEELRKIEALKTRILNAAAHELRTPITPLKLQVHLLKSRAGNLDDRQRRAVSVLDRNVDRLAVLLQDVLDVSRLQSGRLELRRGVVDLAPLLREAASAFEEHADEAGLALRTDLPDRLLVEGDPHRLAQVAYNLLANAIKFTPAGGTVTLRGLRAPHAVRVEVADTGVGIPADRLRTLFQPFANAAQAAHAQEGAGLGLFLSRGIVAMHYGRLGVDSEGIGRGSTFFFELPAASAAPPLPARRPPARADVAAKA